MPVVDGTGGSAGLQTESPYQIEFLITYEELFDVMIDNREHSLHTEQIHVRRNDK